MWALSSVAAVTSGAAARCKIAGSASSACDKADRVNTPALSRWPNASREAPACSCANASSKAARSRAVIRTSRAVRGSGMCLGRDRTAGQRVQLWLRLRRRRQLRIAAAFTENLLAFELRRHAWTGETRLLQIVVERFITDLVGLRQERQGVQIDVGTDEVGIELDFDRGFIDAFGHARPERRPAQRDRQSETAAADNRSQRGVVAGVAHLYRRRGFLRDLRILEQARSEDRHHPLFRRERILKRGEPLSGELEVLCIRARILEDPRGAAADAQFAAHFGAGHDRRRERREVSAMLEIRT